MEVEAREAEGEAMAEAPLTDVIRHIRGLAGAQGQRERSDGELLAAFRADGEPGAFAALVGRHGPMVLGVCRRVLRQAQDAEDAFQATFLLLARGAASIRKPESLAGWLHGVAQRMAGNAKRAAARRRRHEEEAARSRQARPEPDLAWREVRALLDEEIERLPESCRVPFLLCHLEHRPQADVARELGLKEGTLWSRLARARRLLQQRLSRRGIDLTAVLAAAAVADAASAAVPGRLVAATARAAAVAGGGVSAEVAALVKGGLKAMTIRAKVGLLLLLAGVLTAGAGVAAYRAPVGKEPAAPGSPTPQAGPARAEGPTQARTDRYGDPLPPGALARLGTVRLRQGGALAFLPDGRSLIAGGFGNTRLVRLWQVPGGKELRRLGEPARGWLRSIALSPDGTVLATASWGREGYLVRLWDVVTAKEVRRIDVFAGLGEGLAFSPDGQVLAVAGSGKVRLYEVATARPLREFGPDEQLRTVAFSPDGKLVATGGYGRSVHVWEAATGKQVRALEHGAEIHSVIFSPDGAVLASAGQDGTIRLWTTATGKQLRQLPGHRGAALCVTFSPDGKTLASGSRGSIIHLWEAATGRELRHLEGHQGPVRSLVFSPDGATLASESEDFTIRLWDPASGREWTRTDGHQGQVSAVAFSPDGKTLASGAFYDRTLRLWDPAAGAEWRGFRGHRDGVLSVAFSPDGRLLASGGAENDGTVRLWEAATGKERHVLPGKGRVERLAFSPDGRLLASADWGGLHLWDPKTGRPVRDLGRQDYGAFAFSPDGKFLAAVHQQSLCVWEAATGRELRRFDELPRGTRTIAFSPDGRLLATGGYGEAPDEGKGGGGASTSYERVLCLWDVAGGRELRRLKGPEEAVFAVVFSPDGRTLAAGTDAGAVHLWEVLTGKPRLRLAGQRNTIGALAFSPDGRRLASGSYDSTILVWSALGPTPSANRPLAKLWEDLAGADAGEAYRAVGVLAAAPEKAVPFLAERLGQLPTADAPQTQRLIADLDSDEFAVRERASGELARLGERAEPALRQALERGPSPEGRRRIQDLLGKLDAAGSSPGTLSTVRAVEALEHAGTAEARQLLAKLARGAPGVRLTREAQAALGRLAR
jgi:RNA polymerase sigma factor (sigma-70 family)